MSTLIEKETVFRDYGLPGINAIIRHKGELLLITDGFGGQDKIAGGAVRWQHGRAYKLRDGDTLRGLHHGDYNSVTSKWRAVIDGHDDCRTLLDWPGYVIAAIAKKLAL